MATKANNGLLRPIARPWDGVPKPDCVEEPVPLRLPFKSQYEMPPENENVWQRTLGYDDTNIIPHTVLPITNSYQSPCFVPKGMSTEPIHYPNLVTGFERNPQNAARAALNVRYGDQEWTRGCTALYSEATRTKTTCEKIRSAAIHLMHKTDEETVSGHAHVTKHLEERLNEIDFWQKELNVERDKAKVEVSLLTDMKVNISRCLQDLEAPMHIAQECLRHREGRQGVERERDLIEERLLQEVENLRHSRLKFSEIQTDTDRLFAELLRAQYRLEEDIAHKHAAIGIDKICRDLENSSGEVAYRGGIEETAKALTTIETWTEECSRRVEDSQEVRSKSAELRTSLGTLIASIAASVHEHYANTNWALERGQVRLSNEITKTETHLTAVRNEKFQLDKYVMLLRKSISDKSQPLMVAQTRLEARCHRQGLELCDDLAHRCLITEIGDIQNSIEKLHEYLQNTESKYDQLMKTIRNLEEDLKHRHIV